MRGTPFDLDSTMVGVGIIPAYAGNTEFKRIGPCANLDHPRVCGEHPVMLGL